MALDDKLDQVKGAVKENVGKLTDDKLMILQMMLRKLQMMLKMLQKVRLVALKMHWAMMTNKIK